MKIIHISTTDIDGGAALAAYRLHKGLQRAGHDSGMFVERKCGCDESVTAFVPPNDLVERIKRRWRRFEINRDFRSHRQSRPPGYERFSDDRTVHGAEIVSQLPPCDVVNLHAIDEFVDYQGFFSALPRRMPIVWRLADMNAFTGGCHYDHDCGRLSSGCGSCPQLGSKNPDDLSRRVWKRKQQAFSVLEQKRLHIVALCRWMAALISESPLLSRFPSSIIPNGVDLEEFAPRDQKFAREVLGIPHNAHVVMFVSDEVTNRRKGFSLLSEALAGLAHDADLFLVAVGRGQAPVSGIPTLQVGHVGDNRWLSLIYSAADIFVIPSLQDNLPNTVLEAMACGTPVVGFAVGGISDMVREGITGCLVPPHDVVSLRLTIKSLLFDRTKTKTMGDQARRLAVNEYSRELQVRRYVDIYKALL